MSDGHRSIEDAMVLAESKGCIIVYPGPRELFIDIDSASDYEVFKVAFDILRKQVAEPIRLVRDDPSQSGIAGRRHIVVDMSRALSEPERIALQAALGSDRTRETLSMVRWLEGDPQPTLFFEKKGKAPTDGKRKRDERKQDGGGILGPSFDDSPCFDDPPAPRVRGHGSVKGVRDRPKGR